MFNGENDHKPSWEVCGAEIDEEVPLPLLHGQQVLHAVQVGLQEAGSSPDGHHPPGRGSYVWVLLSDLQHLSMHVAGPLEDLISKSH